jgi:primosomal protein N' (replication factor Y)
MDTPQNSPEVEETRYAGGNRVAVLLRLPLGGCYDYLVPEGMVLRPGDFVKVPLGSSISMGVVWGAGKDSVPQHKMKTVLATLDTPPLPDASARFVDWVASYTLSPPGAVLRMVMSVPDALQPPKPVIAYGLSEKPIDFKITPARQRVIETLRGSPPRPPVFIARQAGVSVGVIKGLAEIGVLERVSLSRGGDLAHDVPNPDAPGFALSKSQQAAAEVLIAGVGRGEHKTAEFGVFVLDGVPGSGKTEVYFEAIAQSLRNGKQALVLLPEIALGAQWRTRFKARFGVLPLEWHSDLSPAKRREIWRRISRGGPLVLVGARSALFLPYPDLGLIVADEEHDAAYKQEEGVIYNGRDMAVVRARIGGFPIVLASATPSLETVINIRDGRYHVLHLDERHGGANMPEVDLVNMCTEALPSGQWISATLKQALVKTLADGEQAMLFLNRRGYAPLTLCRGCGYRLKCPNCTAWLVEHRRHARLQCHHCGFSPPRPKICPECEAEGRFAACGPGVERLAEELESLFPDIRYTIAASDTLAGPRATEALVRSIENHDIDVIIGTQVVAKGYHFPKLTLVGVIDADLGLSGGDLRAAERTYQLLYQVAGRAGREERPGRVLVQTYLPDHPVMQALVTTGRKEFMDIEIKARQLSGMPPFGRLAALIISGKNETAVDQAARTLGRNAPYGKAIMVLGPAPAPIALLRGRHRRRLLLKTHKGVSLQAVLKKWLAQSSIPGSVKVQIDVDPYSFM